MSLTEKDQQRILGTLNVLARKVFDATPIEERWTHKQITGELRRRGHNVESSTVMGCLRALTDAGLVRERGIQFNRIALRSPAEAPPLIDLNRVETDARATPEPVTQLRSTESMPFNRSGNPGASSNIAPIRGDSLIDRMGGIAAALRRHAKDSEALASEIEDAALAAQQQVEAASADGAKLRQLQNLMRDVLGGGGS